MPDLAKILELALKITDAHQITNLFLSIIIITFLISLLFAMAGIGRKFTRYTSALLTSLGILGTFIGIVIGLLDFNPQDIDGSIELLLNGLKTAFITSLVGMGSAIAFQLTGTTPLFRENRIKNEIVDVEPKDILNAITSQEKHLEKLIGAISAGDESSLTGQIKILRQDVNDNHKAQQKGFSEFSTELWTHLEAFSEMLSKSATEQVIEALKNVIADFNNNLTEQFGENFKALDASVKKLVGWQDNYRIQLEEMDKQYNQSVQAISEIEKSVTNINTEAKEIPVTMNSLKTVLETNQHQIKELASHLEAFKEVKEQAVQAFPEIQKHIDKTIEEIATSSQKASKGYQLLLDKTAGTQTTFTDSIEKVQKQLESTVSELVEKQVHEMSKSFNAMEDEVSKSVKLTGDAVNKQLEMMDESMTQEMNRVMTEMGKSLTHISGQFTSDYKELVTAMGKITGPRG